MKDLNVFFLINMTVAISYSLPIPLYTELAYNRNFSESFVGFVFSVYSIANLTMIPFTNRLINKVGRYNLLIIACIINTLSTVLYISLDYTINELTFAIISLLTRTLQGLSVELINILIFSLASSIGEIEECGKNLSFVEMASSLGLILGPFLSFCFGMLGYSVPFVICFLMNLLTIYMLINGLESDPEEFNKVSSGSGSDDDEIFSKIDSKDMSFYTTSLGISKRNSATNLAQHIKPRGILVDKEKKRFYDDIKIKRKCFSYDDISSASSSEDEENEESLLSETYSIKYESGRDDNKTVVYFFSQLIRKEIVYTFIVVIIDYISQNFFIPVFTLVMKRNYNIDANLSSAILSLIYFLYFISLKFVGTFLEIFPAKYLLCVGLLINSFALLLLNPIGLFPHSLLYSISGFCLLNAFSGFVTIGSLVDFSHSLRKLGYNEYLANDNGSAYYALAVNVAELIGPLLGGIITEYKSFEFSTIVIGLSSLVASMSFFIYNAKKLYSHLLKGKKKKS